MTGCKDTALPLMWSSSKAIPLANKLRTSQNNKAATTKCLSCVWSCVLLCLVLMASLQEDSMLPFSGEADSEKSPRSRIQWASVVPQRQAGLTKACTPHGCTNTTPPHSYPKQHKQLIMPDAQLGQLTPAIQHSGGWGRKITLGSRTAWMTMRPCLIKSIKERLGVF